MQYALAVDIGGTKATVASIDGTLNVIHRREIATGSASNLDGALIKASKDVIAATSGELIGVGIGSAGPLNLSAGTISPVNIPSWRCYQIVDLFKQLTSCNNVVLHGDGMAVADAEHQLGAGRGSRNMLGMVVSTGVGGGLILDNKLVSGESGNVSFFGHHSITLEFVAPVVVLAALKRMQVDRAWSGARKISVGTLQQLTLLPLHNLPEMVIQLQFK